MRSFLRGVLDGYLDLLFAPICLGCRAPISTAAADRVVCGVCWSRARPLPRPSCDRCGTPRVVPPGAGAAQPAYCSTCAALPPSVRGVRSAFLLEDPARRLVHALKYEGWSCAARPMGGRMAAVTLPRETAEEVRVVVPVPLSRVRLRGRGYNQAELLARAVADRKGLACAPELLVRGRSTETQTALHPAERRANVAGAFRVPPDRAARLRGEHLLLVDDVWTTGATSLACADALIRAGARAVSVLTFARALPDLHR